MENKLTLDQCQTIWNFTDELDKLKEQKGDALLHDTTAGTPAFLRLKQEPYKHYDFKHEHSDTHIKITDFYQEMKSLITDSEEKRNEGQGPFGTVDESVSPFNIDNTPYKEWFESLLDPEKLEHEFLATRKAGEIPLLIFHFAEEMSYARNRFRHKDGAQAKDYLKKLYGQILYAVKTSKWKNIYKGVKFDRPDDAETYKHYDMSQTYPYVVEACFRASDSPQWIKEWLVERELKNYFRIKKQPNPSIPALTQQQLVLSRFFANTRDKDSAYFGIKIIAETKDIDLFYAFYRYRKMDEIKKSIRLDLDGLSSQELNECARDFFKLGLNDDVLKIIGHKSANSDTYRIVRNELAQDKQLQESNKDLFAVVNRVCNLEKELEQKNSAKSEPYNRIFDNKNNLCPKLC